MENNTDKTQTTNQVSSAAQSESVVSTKKSSTKAITILVGFILITVVSVVFISQKTSKNIPIQTPPETPAPKDFVIATTSRNIAIAKSNIATLEANTDIFFDRFGSYSGVCGSSDLQAGLVSLKGFITGDIVCFDDVKGYILGAMVEDVDGIKTICRDSAGGFAFIPGNASDLIKTSGDRCPKQSL